jgi:hypothetical protein
LSELRALNQKWPSKHRLCLNAGSFSLDR